MEKFFFGDHLKPGDEEGLLFAVAAWVCVKNKSIDTEKILMDEKNDTVVKPSYHPVFSLLCHTQYWDNLDQRWAFYKNQKPVWSTFEQVCSPEAMQTSKEHLDKLLNLVSSELRKMLQDYMKVDFQSLSIIQESLEDYTTRPTDDNTLLKFFPTIENKGSLRVLAKNTWRYFRGKLGLHFMGPSINACRYERWRTVPGWEVWSLRDMVGPSGHTGFVSRPDLDPEWSTEMEIKIKKERKILIRHESEKLGRDPDLEAAFPEHGIFFNEDKLLILAFGYATGLNLDSQSPMLMSIHDRLLDECGNNVQDLEKRMLEIFRNLIIWHEKGHFRMQRTEENFFKEIEDSLGFAIKMDLEEFVSEVLADQWAFEQKTPSFGSETFDATLLIYSRFILETKLKNCIELDEMGYSSAKLLSVLSLWTDCPAEFLAQELKKVLNKVNSLKSATHFKQWYIRWHEDKMLKVREIAYGNISNLPPPNHP